MMENNRIENELNNYVAWCREAIKSLTENPKLKKLFARLVLCVFLLYNSFEH